MELPKKFYCQFKLRIFSILKPGLIFVRLEECSNHIICILALHNVKLYFKTGPRKLKVYIWKYQISWPKGRWLLVAECLLAQWTSSWSYLSFKFSALGLSGSLMLSKSWIRNCRFSNFGNNVKKFLTADLVLSPADFRNEIQSPGPNQ